MTGTYRQSYDKNPAKVSSHYFGAVTPDLGDPARYGVQFEDSGLQWVQFIDGGSRAWWVPMFEGDDPKTAKPLWDWGELIRRNERGYGPSYQQYRNAEKRLADRLSLQINQVTWIERQAPVVVSGADHRCITPDCQGSDTRMFKLQDGTPVDLRQWNLTGKYPERWGIYVEPFPGATPLTPYGSGIGWGTDRSVALGVRNGGEHYIPTYLEPATDGNSPWISNCRVDLFMNGVKVFCIGNPWLRIAMPTGLPGEVSSDNGAFEAFKTFVDLVEIVIGYITDNVVMMAAASADLVQTWYGYANAGNARAAMSRKINDALRGKAGALGGRMSVPPVHEVASRFRGKHSYPITRRVK